MLLVSFAASADGEYHVPGEIIKDKKEKKKEKSSGYEFPELEVTPMTKVILCFHILIHCVITAAICPKLCGNCAFPKKFPHQEIRRSYILINQALMKPCASFA